MPKKPLKEHQRVRIIQPVKADLVGRKSDQVVLPAGTPGAIILIGDPADPKMYMIEFHLWDRDDYATANVPAEFVEPVYTPEEEAVLAQYMQRANDSREEVKALDRNWWPPDYWAPFGANSSPTFAERLKNLEDDIVAAQARLKELREISATPAGPPNKDI